MHVVHSTLNVAPELKLMTAFVDLDRARLPCPVVDILEKMAIDCAKMLQIEIACRYPTPCL